MSALPTTTQFQDAFTAWFNGLVTKPSLSPSSPYPTPRLVDSAPLTFAQIQALLTAPTTAGYLVYSAILSQTGVLPPTATVLQNTLGGVPIYSYDDTGLYRVSLAGAFPPSKTLVFFTFPAAAASGANAVNGPDDVSIQTGSDDWTGASLQIIVFP